MEKEEKWALANSHNYSLKTKEIIFGRVEEAAAEEELSLCDLPIIHHQFVKEIREGEKVKAVQEPQQDFDFCSLSIESKMCPADELFSQGQFLPLRHYVSSEMGLSLHRNESMDNFYSSRSISCLSSSSSINRRRRHLNSPRNQFHSYPSPSPRILRPNTKPGLILNSAGYMDNPSTKLSVWRIFRRGLVAPPPEIAFQDLENRNKTNCYNFGSRNSATKKGKEEEKKRRKSNPRFLNGCKCSDNDAVPTTLAIIRRRASDGEEESVKLMRQEENKKRLSYRRTFEWLKQLSIECSEDDDEA